MSKQVAYCFTTMHIFHFRMILISSQQSMRRICQVCGDCQGEKPRAAFQKLLPPFVFNSGNLRVVSLSGQKWIEYSPFEVLCFYHVFYQTVHCCANSFCCCKHLFYEYKDKMFIYCKIELVCERYA